METVVLSEGEPTWVFPSQSVTQTLLQSLTGSSQRLCELAALLPGGRAGWSGSGLEYCLYPSGQRCLSGFAENADVTFTVELVPPGSDVAGSGVWDVTAEISVRCDAEIDCGMHVVEAFTPNTYATAEDAVSAVEKSSRWLLERSKAIPPEEWRSKDQRSRHP